MDQALTFDKIFVGRQYKVVKMPPHWVQRYPSEYMGRIGECEWKNSHTGVCLKFDASLDLRRQFPPECLEEVKDMDKVLLTGDAKKIELMPETVKIGSLYKIISVPSWYSKTNLPYRALGKIGTCINIHPFGLMLSITELKAQCYIPFQNIEEVKITIIPKEITDKELISKMVSNPLGALKIVRGLSKMNKNLHLRSFLEQGSI